MTLLRPIECSVRRTIYDSEESISQCNGLDIKRSFVVMFDNRGNPYVHEKNEFDTKEEVRKREAIEGREAFIKQYKSQFGVDPPSDCSVMKHYERVASGDFKDYEDEYSRYKS